jgi:hypothetical protein
MANSPYLTDQAVLGASPEVVGLERQRKLADLLTSQSFQSPQGQMISGHYVKPAATQQMQPLLSALLATNMNQNLDEKQTQLAAALRGKKADEINQIMSAVKSGDNQLATALAANSETGVGKEFMSPLLGNILPKTPDSVAEFQMMQSNPAYKEWKNQLTPMQQAQLKNEEVRLGFEKQKVGLEGAKFNLEKQKIEQELAQGKPLTEFQGKAVAYGIAMQDASNNMKKIEEKGFNPASLKNQTSVSMAGGTTGNLFVSPEARQYKQAQDQFAEAYLRFKSGANTPEPEIQRNLRNMMPAIGDDKATLDQKQKARNEAARAMAIASGPAGANKIQNPAPMYVGQPNVQVSPAGQTPKVVDFNSLPTGAR